MSSTWCTGVTIILAAAAIVGACKPNPGTPPGDSDPSPAGDPVTIGGDAALGDATVTDQASGDHAPWQTPACAAAPLTAIAAIPYAAAGSDAPVPATAGERQALAMAINALVAGNDEAAHTLAGTAGYTLCAGQGAEADLQLLRPADTGLGRAWIILRHASARRLIVEAPHPVYDTDSDLEALRIFDEANARALVVSGSHRCASSGASACDGVTSTCGGGSQPYRRSDAAHAADLAFEVAHETLAEAFGTAIALSVHGMGGAGVSLSDGTSDSTTNNAAVARLAADLAARLPAELVTVCNDHPAAAANNVTVDLRLCGSTNVQGRFSNGSTSPCDAAAGGASGRFLHMEQALNLRQDPAAVAEIIAALTALIGED